MNEWRIDFYDEAFSAAIEIDDMDLVATAKGEENAVLPEEVETIELASANRVPEYLLMRRWMIAQVTGMIAQCRASDSFWEHLSHLHNREFFW